MAKKIMILDDDEATAELIEYYLKEEGFQTAISLTGEGFPEKVAEYQPDLITLDILLPEKQELPMTLKTHFLLVFPHRFQQVYG